MEKIQIPTDTLTGMSSDFKSSAETNLQNLKDGKFSFDLINQNMAKTVTAPSTFLLCADIEAYGKEVEIENDFIQFCLEIGKNFEGKKAGTSEYDNARDGVGELVIKYLPEIMQKLDIKANASDVFNKVDVVALKKVLSPDYGIPFDDNETIDQYKTSLKTTLPEDDSFHKAVDELKATENINFTDDEIKCLKIGIALAQAGYIHSQLFRSIEEDPKSKVRRFDRPVFDINVNMRQKIFRDAVGDMNQKLDRLTFEVYKDVLQLKQVVSAKITS